MNCSKNFHSSLDFVNSASKHSVVQHCTAGVRKQSKLYIYIYNYSPSRSKTPSSLWPLHLYFYLGQNLVTVFSAICLALSMDFNSSNTWSWPSTTSWTTLRTTSRSCPWSCPSIPLLSLDQGEVFSSYMDLVPLFLHLLDQEGISERLLVPVPLFWLMM